MSFNEQKKEVTVQEVINSYNSAKLSLFKYKEFEGSFSTELTKSCDMLVGGLVEATKINRQLEEENELLKEEIKRQKGEVKAL